jgi:hypothetical protein
MLHALSRGIGRRRAVVCVSAVLMLAVGVAAAGAVTISESGDAGSLPASAQPASAADAITGVLDGANDVDMYRLCLSGGKTFSASTVPADGGNYTSPGGAFPNDSQLFLLDADGRAVYSVDDPGGSGETRAKLPANHALTPAAAGAYYLAITDFNNDPRDSGGVRIFNDSVLLGSGVLGPAGNNAIASWSNEGSINGGGGPYTIALTGTVGCLTLTGFFQPIDNDAINSAKAGQTIPVKWHLADADGNPIDDPATFVSVSSTPSGGACSGLPSDAIETYAGDSGLQYLGDGNWQFNWQTPKSYAGQCRTMTLTLNDGTTRSANFQFK